MEDRCLAKVAFALPHPPDAEECYGKQEDQEGEQGREVSAHIGLKLRGGSPL
jgi:hypothetical protein